MIFYNSCTKCLGSRGPQAVGGGEGGPGERPLPLTIFLMTNMIPSEHMEMVGKYKPGRKEKVFFLC